MLGKLLLKKAKAILLYCKIWIISHAAGFSDWEANVGSITKGKFVNITALDTNPMGDIRILNQVKFVMKEGIVYKSEFTDNIAGNYK